MYCQDEWVLRFIQVTRATKHGLKIFYMRQFVDAFNLVRKEEDKVTRVEVAIITSAINAYLYTLPTVVEVVGSLETYQWKLCDLKVFGYERTEI